MSSSFYGNIKNNSRASFIFDRIYCSRYEMEYNLSHAKDDNGEIEGDGVFVNRYVLVNYGYIDADSNTNSVKVGYSRVDPRYVQGSDETYIPALHIVNINNYTNFYIYSDNQFTQANVRFTRNQLENSYYYYQKVNFCDRFDTSVYFGTSSTPNVISSDQQISAFENAYFASNRAKDANEYGADYHLTVWMKIYTDNKERYIQVGRLLAKAPALELCDAPPSQLVVPGSNTSDGTSWNQHAPFFDLLKSSDINYKYYMPKHWDIKLGNIEYNKAGFAPIKRTYISSPKDDIYFVIASSGKNYPKMKGYKIDLTPDTYIPNKYFLDENCSQLSTGDFDANAYYYVKTQEYVNGIPQTIEAGDQKNLQVYMQSIGNAVSDLYDSLYGYVTSGLNRPYNWQDLFHTDNIAPYNNLTSQDQVSMAWGVEELKKYISELRFLSHGLEDGTPSIPEAGKGLQSDWTSDTKTSFGYIYHRPRILWSNGGGTETEKINSGNSPETDYFSRHSIEYIYDHYTSANTTLFGFDRQSDSNVTRTIGNATNSAPWLQNNV